MNSFSKGKIPAMVLMGLAVAPALHADSGVPHPDLIFMEAEGIQDVEYEKITTPLLIKDDPLASHGRYVEVIGGNKSMDVMPAIEGVDSLDFDQSEPSSAALFTIWARVIAPTTDHDSFWLKVDNGAPIIAILPLGTAWHWVQIKAKGSSTAAKFSLAQGGHTLKFAYREDGAKIDQFVITSNSSYNPNSTHTPLIEPYLSANTDATTLTGNILSWDEIPGAVSYTLVKSTSSGESVVYTGKNHSRTVSGQDGYYVYANALDGSRMVSNGQIISSHEFSNRYRIPYYYMSFTPPFNQAPPGEGPLYIDPNSGIASSMNAPPLHGRGRYDFQIATATKVRVYGEVAAPNSSSDSYWVRMDQGAWVKWNNIPDFTCSPVRNSDTGNAIVDYQLAAGSHFLEFAYRESGTSLNRFGIIPSNSTNTAACED